MKYLILCLLSLNIYANDLKNAPSSFQKGNKSYQFVDFQTVNYKISYDLKTQTAEYFAHIKFEITNKGYPLFDVVNAPEVIMIGADGTRFEENVSATLISLPNRTSEMFALDKEVEPGLYHLKITGKITRLVKFNSNTVRSAFWMSDLEDRAFLERYLPTNLDYDQYQMDLDVEVENSDVEHVLMVNCEKTELKKNHWKMSCPAYYTSSLLFFHLFEEGAYEVETFTMESINKKSVEFTVYTNETMSRYTELAKKVFVELENDYGPWLHDQMIIYGTGGMFGGGMEYAGATLTSIRALGHEMHHSYFARAMSPAGGNAGWVDEALASWRDSNYPRGGGLSRTQMGGHSEYNRVTDRNAYSKGMNFIAHIDEKVAEKNGLMPFLKDFGQTYKYQTFTTEFFQSKLEDFFNQDFSELFNGYIYGVAKSCGVNNPCVELMDLGAELVPENPYHPQLSEEQLENLL